MVEEKQEMIEQLVDFAKKRGFDDLKVNDPADDHDSPDSFMRKNDEESFAPDATGLKYGAKSYFEIALKSENEQRIVSKWQLLSKLAQMKNGKLYLLAPRGSKSFADRLVDRYNIVAEVYSI